MNYSSVEPLPAMRQDTSHILIVDDEPTNRIILATILEQDGYFFHEAEDGPQALAFVDKISPDLILLDIMMPKMSGYETCRRLKNNQNTAEIPIIFITALDDQESILKGFEVGAVDYLTKPFSENEVKARVRTHLQLKTATDKVKRYSEELEQVVAEESKELIKAERQAAFGQLIQGIVHNLKSPLTAIRAGAQTGKTNLDSLSEILHENLLSDAPDLKRILDGVYRSLCIIDSASNRLTEMINMMMARSSKEKEKLELANLNDIIREELDFLNADLHFKNKIQKTITLAAENLPIMTAHSAMAQVFNNLISNTIDALHEHPEPEIKITTFNTGRDAVLTVSDNGSGISNDDLPKIFDPLFTTKPRVSNNFDSSQGPTGTGLGLYMCMRTIKAMHGEIKVSSKLNQGTTVEIKIPLAKEIRI
ncbi:MAG: hybrid sensor histidine kinase/response regulator [Proteobacteria bacterium]|nr:hybrid sensor histidine kinase/response regulator [Pseudomonadota bacterium]MBU1715224.1 hybrid sensor histidine kinase/response regulator [Pseudomonadota bacterium]